MGGIYPPPPVLPTNKITLQTTSAMHAVAAIVEVPGSSESRKSSYAPEVKSHTVYSTNSENKRLCLNLHSCLVQTHNTETNCGISAYRKEIQLQEIHFVSDSFPKLGYWGHVRQRNIVSKLGGKHIHYCAFLSLSQFESPVLIMHQYQTRPPCSMIL